MKILRLLTVLLLLVGAGFGQASRYTSVAQTTRYINGVPASTPLPFASILVCPYPGSCTLATAATLYADQTGTTTAPNPTSADVNGNFGFWAASGNYQYVITFRGAALPPVAISIGGSGGSSVISNTVTNLQTLLSAAGQTGQATDGTRGQYWKSGGFVHPVSTDINVQDFGASGDGGTYPQVSCGNGSATISNVAPLQGRPPKAGDIIVVSGCGVAGADLQCTVSGGTATTGTLFGTVICGGGITAGATLSNRGSHWGGSADDTPAVTAAIAYCERYSATGGSNGCKIKFPAGLFFISNIVTPTVSQSGSLMLQGAGRTATWIIGTGADQTAVIQAPANAAPLYVDGFGFSSYDYKNKTQIATQWLGGQEHTFSNNYVGNMWEMVNASNTWINLISNNRCYGVKGHCIEFGTGLGNDTVNATRVVFNELAAWGNAGADSTKHAYYFHSGSGSYENTFAFNSIEADNGTPGEPLDVNDNLSHYIVEYIEVSGVPSGYFGIFRGTGQQLRFHGIPCIWVTSTASANVFGGVGNACPAQTYSIKNDGNVNAYGINPEILSNINGTTNSVYGLAMLSAQLRTYTTGSSSASNGWPIGRIDFVDTPFTRSASSGASGTNPTSPSGFSTGAAIRYGTIVANRDYNNTFGSTLDNNVFWICDNGFGVNCSFPIVPSQWKRFGERSSKVRAEGTAAPGSGTWTVGDFLWNTNPTTGIVGWVCSTAGTPGTWVPMYAIDPASPQAIGGTTPNTIKGTTINATTAYQVNGTPVVQSCGTTTTCSNSAVSLGRTVIGSVALTGGTATITGLSPAFTSTSSFFCTCTDQATTPAACSVQNASSSSITVKGTGTDVINYHCVGN